MYKKWARTVSFRRSPSKVVNKSLGICSPFLKIIQCTHSCVNSLTFLLSSVQKYWSAMISQMTVYVWCPFSPQCTSNDILSFWPLYCSGIHILWLWYMVSPSHCKFIATTRLLNYFCSTFSVLTAVVVVASGTMPCYRAAIGPDLALMVLCTSGHLVRMSANTLLNPSTWLMYNWNMDRFITDSCAFDTTWRGEFGLSARGANTNNRFLWSVSMCACFALHSK